MVHVRTDGIHLDLWSTYGHPIGGPVVNLRSTYGLGTVGWSHAFGLAAGALVIGGSMVHVRTIDPPMDHRSTSGRRSTYGPSVHLWTIGPPMDLWSIYGHPIGGPMVNLRSTYGPGTVGGPVLSVLPAAPSIGSTGPTQGT